MGMLTEGAAYFYITNLQGDVVGILDSAGVPVVSYTYDAWGNLLSTTGSLAGTIGALNPLRYRGYVYDTEWGLYYLQSRYYDPDLSRFLNTDALVANAGENFLGYNLFAYCFNNPVNMHDSDGNWPSWLTTVVAVAAATVAVVATVATLGAAAPAAACSLTLMATSVGVSYATATTVATVAVTTTVGVSALYAGDAAYSAVSGTSPLKETVFNGNEEAYNTGAAIATIATAGMVNAAAMSPGVCFVAGTPVHAEYGYIAIEEIKTGDLVWAEDPETGEKELKEVVRTFVNETTELIYVQIGSEEIVTTPEHPFYSPVKGWTEACRLRAGDILVTVNGEYVVVEKIQHEILEAPITVYNFEVEGFHTYYVSNIGVLVHNSCGGETPATKRGRQMHKDWDYGPGVEKEQPIGIGARVDGIDSVNKIVYELKPNNSQAIRRGLRQLNRYLAILGESDWAGVLILYD